MRQKNIIYTRTYNSPCGMIVLGSFNGKLCLCDWCGEKHINYVNNKLKRILNADLYEETSPVIEDAAVQLDEYFKGTRRTFSIPLLFTGTDFQKRVWNALLEIPYGKTVSYGEIAGQTGRLSAVRAVANANGANAISIFVPCHRVIGSNGALTGYRGGLHAKKYLLDIEKNGVK